jgi:hypothetical protein
VEAGSILLSVHVHDSEVSLVGFWRIDKPLHTLLEVCPAHKDKVEIKYIGSVGEKTSIEPKLYLLFSNFGHMEQDEFDVMRFVPL